MFVVLDYVTAEGCEVAGRSCIRSVFAVAVDAQRALRHLSLLVGSLLQLVRHLSGSAAVVSTRVLGDRSDAVLG